MLSVYLVALRNDGPGPIMIVRRARINAVELEQCVQLRKPERLMLLGKLNKVLHGTQGIGKWRVSSVGDTQGVSMIVKCYGELHVIYLHYTYYIGWIVCLD